MCLKASFRPFLYILTFSYIILSLFFLCLFVLLFSLLMCYSCFSTIKGRNIYNFNRLVSGSFAVS